MDEYQGSQDEDLIRAYAQEQDRQALDALVRRHQTRVYGLAYRILGNREDALDATQEAFLTLFRKASSFKGKSAFTTWMYRVVVNASYDVSRRSHRREEPVVEVDPGHQPDSTEEVEGRLWLQQALSFLPADQRTAVVLRDVHGLSYDEIAEVTKTRIGTVKSRIARARAGLLEIVGERERDEESARLREIEGS